MNRHPSTFIHTRRAIKLQISHKLGIMAATFLHVFLLHERCCATDSAFLLFCMYSKLHSVIVSRFSSWKKDDFLFAQLTQQGLNSSRNSSTAVASLKQFRCLAWQRYSKGFPVFFGPWLALNMYSWRSTCLRSM